MSTLSPVFTLAVCRTSSGRITAGLLPDEVIFLLSLRGVASERDAEQALRPARGFVERFRALMAV
jgi:hypothetical protein